MSRELPRFAYAVGERICACPYNGICRSEIQVGIHQAVTEGRLTVEECGWYERQRRREADEEARVERDAIQGEGP